MSWVPAERVLQTVASQRQVLDQEQLRMNNFQQHHATERAKLEAERLQAASDLGAAVLAKLDAASIAATANAVGLPGLPAENIPGKLEQRRAWLAQRMTQILHDPRYVQRELLRHPRTGSLTRAVAESEEMRKPALEIVQTCEAQPRFQKLWNENYGLPDTSTPWWRYSYWQDRDAANELCGRLDKKEFSDVRDTYAKAREELAVFDQDIMRIRGEMAAGEAIEKEYAALYDEHQHIDQRGLEHTRNRIVQHLLTSDPSMVGQRLRPFQAVHMLFLRASGIASKIAYLDNIQRQNLAEMQKDYAAQRAKLDDVEMKTRRRWAPMPMERFQKISEDRRPRYEKRWQRFGKVYNTVYVYDRWDRARWYDDLLWWDVMTRGRYDGSYIPEVSYWHQQHPGYVYNPHVTRPDDYRREDWYDSSSDSGPDLDTGTSDDSTAAAYAIENDNTPDASDTDRDVADSPDASDSSDTSDNADAGDLLTGTDAS